MINRKDGESIMVARMPEAMNFDKKLIESFESVKETISAIRTVRKSKEIPVKERLDLLIRSDKDSFDTEFLSVISKLCNLSGISFVSEKQEGAVAFMVRTTEYFIPLAGTQDVEGEIARLEEGLVYNKGFLVSVMKKLANERFVQNAPPNVLEMERKKKSDAESKIKSIEERIKELRH